jgi:hypothetical protein
MKCGAGIKISELRRACRRSMKRRHFAVIVDRDLSPDILNLPIVKECLAYENCAHRVNSGLEYLTKHSKLPNSERVEKPRAL